MTRWHSILLGIGMIVLVNGFSPSARTLCRLQNRRSHPASTVWHRMAGPDKAGDQYDDVNGDKFEINGETALDIAQDPTKRFRTAAFVLTQAAIIGVLSGWSVSLFKLSIEFVKETLYGASTAYLVLPLIPAFGGLLVGALSLPGAFPPGLRGAAMEVDEFSRKPNKINEVNQPMRFLRKTAASVFTLGTGNSLGPEGPSVEVGMSMSRVCMSIFRSNPDSLESPEHTLNRNRLLLACGAAAGVAAGFNAPISGVFFALEIVQRAFEENSKAADVDEDPSGRESPTTATSNMSAILISSVIAALVTRGILGDELALIASDYTLPTPLAELPLYVGLGATCGLVAFLFSQAAKLAQSIFDGKTGPGFIQRFFRWMPRATKPILGGLLCGLIGLVFPQTLFFGYETLNSLLAKSSLSLGVLLSLLGAKIVSTALCAGSGLVGGTFAPSLFLGAMVGGSFHSILVQLFQFAMEHDVMTMAAAKSIVFLELADVPAYAMVGAASTLAALFRAPLTASLLLFEVTRDYGVILPLMVSAGVGSVVADIIEAKVEQERVLQLRRDRDTVSWGDLSDKYEAQTKTNSEN